MDFDDIVRHWGSVTKAKTALGLKSRQTLYNWKTDGVPEGWQARIQILTDGHLKADEQPRPGDASADHKAATA